VAGFSKFTISLIGFIIPIAFLVGIMELDLRKSGNSLTYKKHNLERNLNKIQVLVLGDSHAHLGINPEYFDLPAFNLANSAQSYYYDVALTRKYMNKMPSLKYVIITISYFNLFYSEINSANTDGCYLYNQVFKIPVEKDGFDLRQYSYVAIYNPYQSLKHLISAEKLSSELTNGYFLIKDGNAFFSKANENNKTLVNRHSTIIATGNAWKNIHLLDLFVKELENKKVCPVVVYMPAQIIYTRKEVPEIDKLNQMFLNYLEKKYHARIINLRTSTLFSNSDFSDPIHLNYIGAKKLSKILAAELSKISH
jgi:hypothetical protein